MKFFEKGFSWETLLFNSYLEVWSNIYIYHEAPSGQCNFLKDDSIRAMYFFEMAPADQLKIAPSEKGNFFKMAPADQSKIAPSEQGNFFKMAPAE